MDAATAHAVLLQNMIRNTGRELDSVYGAEGKPLSLQVPKRLVSEHLKPCLLSVWGWL